MTEDLIKEAQGGYFCLSSDVGVAKEAQSQKNKPVHKIWTIIDSDVKIMDSDTGDIIGILKKNCIPKDQCKVAYDILMPVARSNSNSNRGIAGGLLDMNKVKLARPNFQVGKMTAFRVYPKLKTGEIGKTHYCNPVSSSIVGWTDIPKRDDKSVKCRMTAYTAKNFEKFEETFPFFETIDDNYKKLAPEHHARQMKYSDGTVAMIGKTSFSTITLNHKFRTALHKDAGDYKEGLGAFCVTQSAKTGGELLFPEYGLAVRVSTGDLFLFNSHLWHCTAPIECDDRLTFVCYLRFNIPKNCPKATKARRASSRF